MECASARALQTSWHSSKLTTGCPILDAALHGGIVPHHITEISGESGVGKSQLIMQLMLTAQLPKTYGGLDGTVLYVCTEVVSTQRLNEMAEKIRKSSPNFTNIQFMENILIEKVETPDDLSQVLHARLPWLVGMPLVPVIPSSSYADWVIKAKNMPSKSKPLRLIVIDSIAALFRGRDEDHSKNERKFNVDKAMFLYGISQFLKFISDVYGIAVVVTNQVTSTIRDDGDGIPAGGHANHPALGLSWSNCINTRLWLSKTQHQLELNNTSVNIRRLHVVFAPHLPPCDVDYIITSEGVRGIKQRT